MINLLKCLRVDLKVIFITAVLLLIIGCSTETPIQEVTKIYSMDDVAVVGIKMKGDFKTDFPQSSDAKWGFLKGREVAIIRYPTIELAKTLGKTAGDEQTELLEVIEKNIAHGPKVEKIECRGHTGYGVHGNCSSRREPMYTEFIIHGNLVIMGEPLATEDSFGTIKFLEQTAKSLP